MSGAWGASGFLWVVLRGRGGSYEWSSGRGAGSYGRSQRRGGVRSRIPINHAKITVIMQNVEFKLTLSGVPPPGHQARSPCPLFPHPPTNELQGGGSHFVTDGGSLSQQRRHSSVACFVALSRAVDPSLSSAETSAPASTRNRTTGIWPFCIAHISGIRSSSRLTP